MRTYIKTLFIFLISNSLVHAGVSVSGQPAFTKRTVANETGQMTDQLEDLQEAFLKFFIHEETQSFEFFDINGNPLSPHDALQKGQEGYRVLLPLDPESNTRIGVKIQNTMEETGLRLALEILDFEFKTVYTRTSVILDGKSAEEMNVQIEEAIDKAISRLELSSTNDPIHLQLMNLLLPKAHAGFKSHLHRFFQIVFWGAVAIFLFSTFGLLTVRNTSAYVQQSAVLFIMFSFAIAGLILAYDYVINDEFFPMRE